MNTEIEIIKSNAVFDFEIIHIPQVSEVLKEKGSPICVDCEHVIPDGGVIYLTLDGPVCPGCKEEVTCEEYEMSYDDKEDFPRCDECNRIISLFEDSICTPEGDWCEDCIESHANKESDRQQADQVFRGNTGRF